MKVAMFSSWAVRCGIADYSAQLVAALNNLGDTQAHVVGYDRRPHPRAEYVRWGAAMNGGDVAHVQHEYSFFGYRLPWRNHFGAFAAQITRPLVLTRHVSFDGPLPLAAGTSDYRLRQFKWWLYNRGLGPYARYLNRGMFDRADHVIVLSRHLKDHLTARGYPAERVSIIPPGIAQVPPATGGAELRQRWGWHDRSVLGIFGFVAAAKGHLLALEALARLPASFALLIAGGVRRSQDSGMLPEIDRAITRLGLQGRVRVTGYLPAEQVPAHLDACDLLLFPYTRVDTSFSATTAMAYRAAPLLMSDVAAHRELAERSQAVALFPSGDAGALAHEVQALTADSERRQALLQATEPYVQHQSWESVARQTRAVYQAVVAGPAAASGGPA
jgi:glycosyltransferase involved in cell wall biosynthesis